MVNFDSGTKVPVLRFKDEMGKEYPEWKFRPFSEVYSFKPTKSLSRNQLFFDEDSSISYIHYGDIHTKFRAQFVFSDEIVPFVSPDVDIGNIPCDMYCQDGDLVIADASEDYVGIGKTIEIIDSGKGKIVAGLHTFLARPKLRLVYIGFAAQMMLCEYVRLQIKLIAQGTKVLGISTNRLKTINLPLPCIYEQQKIANFLSSVDTRIDQLEKKKALLEQYKKGLMQKLFSQEIRFKYDQGEEYPGWVEKVLNRVVDIKKGQQLNRDEMILGGNFPVINGGVVASGYTDSHNFKGNVITVSEGGNSCGYVGWQRKDFWLGGHCYALPVSSPSMDPDYLFYYLKNIEEQIMRLRVGSGLPNIQKRDLGELTISFPQVEEQQKIANFLSSVDKKIELIAEQVSQTRDFKKGLLQQMFV